MDFLTDYFKAWKRIGPRRCKKVNDLTLNLTILFYVVSDLLTYFLLEMNMTTEYGACNLTKVYKVDFLMFELYTHHIKIFLKSR